MEKELKLFIALNKAVNSFTKKTNKIVTQYDITYSQFAVLEVLYHKGALSVGDVKEEILSSSGTIAIINKNLEKNKLIVKFQDNKDKRKYILKLTTKGIDLITEVYPKNERMIVNSMNVLDLEEKEYMLNCLQKITGYKR
jgi:MarR family 2-MHQ and catechol resistance regulon transcriptional repressor